MKLQFNAQLDYQKEAIDAIVQIFAGQALAQSTFTVAPLSGQMGLNETTLGIGNRLDQDFTAEDILRNVRNIQLRQCLPPSEQIKEKDYHFTIEMETGTGKTYVYLRTIFELNQKYGFTKFIIVVPSVAIKEGVLKSLEMMEEHFKLLYANVVFKASEYQGKNIENIRDFATSDHIRIMVMTIHSFNKDTNIINMDHERTNGFKPIEFIRDTHPIVIIDEPQSTVNTQKAKDAIQSLNPLCTLRYSATPKDKVNLVYRLDALDAYERQLVKQIEVASVVAKDQHNQAYLRLISVDNKKTPITAKIEIDRLKKGEIRREVVGVKVNSDLFELSGGREQYSGYIVSEIYTAPGAEYVDFTSQDFLSLGEVRGDISDDEIKRVQIRQTIEEHLEKELRLTKEGIKVLSLFFIDRVNNYRYYDQEGNPQKGKYALWFEEEFKRLVQKPKYRGLYKDAELDALAQSVHNGYFAQDKKGVLKDTTGNTQADEDIYNLIMKDKERLLSFGSKLRFIFSHSALKEGWDNPNVFQICTLNETKSEMKKRQEIGRGLRLAVNQRGERIAGFNVNTLTVMANESYEDFARGLQRELEEEEGIKFGRVENHSFANITMEVEGQLKYLGHETSEAIWHYLQAQGYLDSQGKVTEKLKGDLQANRLELPEDYREIAPKVVAVLKKISGGLNIKKAADKRKIQLNKQRFLSPEFQELWARIKYKTSYSVDFDSGELVRVCVQEIKNNLRVDRAKLVLTKGTISEITSGGVVAVEKDRSALVVEDRGYNLPDIITYLQNQTNLTRRTLVRILKESNRLKDFKNNPQKFMDGVAKIIQREIRHLLVDGIKYEKLGDDQFYAQELFKNEELYGYLSKNMLPSDKSVFDHVVYDSTVEESFARRFESNDRVKVYAKLPSWFKIDTPLGPYNPDWAVLVEKDGEEKLYFVVETKGSILAEDLRLKERNKIACGHKHFAALGGQVKFQEQDNFAEFIENI